MNSGDALHREISDKLSSKDTELYNILMEYSNIEDDEFYNCESEQEKNLFVLNVKRILHIKDEESTSVRNRSSALTTFDVVSDSNFIPSMFILIRKTQSSKKIVPNSKNLNPLFTFLKFKLKLVISYIKNPEYQFLINFELEYILNF
ncbi:hypothetical protein HZH66_006958 [Vespula vulgaris]|uniref:Uncharacterized protein n=1 Tax=Vespula vulgaris TaxID=7454 RepID=A0A834K827_VESVU|nr:hypothetical protein HZH66_006958 [Vespula vulgaris]